MSRTPPPPWQTMLQSYQRADNRRACWEILWTYLPFGLCWFLAYRSLFIHPALSFVFCVPAALLMVRIFGIQHECGHGFFVSSRRWADLIGMFSGILTLTPYHCWRKIHALHHRESGNLDLRQDMGDFPTYTVREYQAMSPVQRRRYRLIRHPVMVLGVVPVILFFVLQRLPVNRHMPISRVGHFGALEQRSVWITNLGVLSYLLLLWQWVGWQGLLWVQLPISLMASSFGVFIFFAHHQFENTWWYTGETRDMHKAALQGSSFMNYPAWLQWCIGNGGYHYLHHLNPCIPGYFLPECHQKLQAHPEFQQVPELSFRDSLRIFAYILWDEEQERLIRVRDLPGSDLTQQPL